MNNTLRSNKILVIAFGILLSYGVQAQENDRRRPKEPPTFDQLLKALDANEDGKLSKSEVKGPLKTHFAKIDTDEDGFISEEEFEKAPKPKRRKRRD